MPITKVKTPDGSFIKVKHPDGATKKEIIEYAKNTAPANDIQKFVSSIPARAARGAMDPINSLAQMAEHASPDWLKSAVSSADKYLYDKTSGIIGDPREFSTKLKEEEQAYQQARKATGENGFDGARLSGNMAAMLPLVLAAPEAAPGLLARTGAGAAMGAGFGLLNPVLNDGNFLEEKINQAKTGAFFGGAATPLLAGAGRIISPLKDKAVDLLKSSGVTPAIGQTLGGFAKTAEEKLRSVPILGDFITSAHKRSASELNRAAYNRALKPIDKDAKNIPVGKEGVAQIERELSNAYNDLLPKLTFQSDDVFNSEVNKITDMVQRLPKTQQKRYFNILKDKLINNMTSSGRMSGDSLKKVESGLEKESGKLGKTTDPDWRELKDAIDSLRESIRNSLTRVNPELSEELQSINKGYANYAIIRKASKFSNTEKGFSPAQLDAAVKANDKTLGNYSKGTALMQDLSSAGKNVLAQTIPDSGTAARLGMGLGASSAGFINPTIPLSLLAGGMGYTAPAQKVISTLLTKRPESAAAIAQGVRSLSPVFGGASAGLLDSF